MEGAPQPLTPNEQAGSPEGLPAEVQVTPWRDELVEQLGFGPRSMYVEMCWLPVIGPTATWLYRRLGSWAEFNPDGLKVDLADLSISMGLGESLAKNSGLGRALGRLVRFDIARCFGDEIQVRTALAELPQRHVRRLSPSTARLHEEYVRRPRPQMGGQS